jgi:LPS sulfotransferase NodH
MKAIEKFCVLTTQRSGSTLLLSLLGNHQQVKACDELFHPREPKFLLDQTRFCQFEKTHPGKRPVLTFKYLDRMAADYSSQYEAYGFKLMYNQLTRFPEILSKLVLDRYKIVHLVRENYIDTALSSKLARENQVFHSTTDTNIKSVYIDPLWFLKQLKKQDTRVRWADLFLSILPIPSLRITYDDLCRDPISTIKIILGFLSISIPENFSPKSEMKKVNQKSYREAIVNFEEVRTALKDTKFYDLLGIDK